MTQDIFDTIDRFQAHGVVISYFKLPKPRSQLQTVRNLHDSRMTDGTYSAAAADDAAPEITGGG